MADLGRMTMLLKVIAKGRGSLTMTDLAMRTGLPRSSVHRLLQTLEEGQYVTNTPDRAGYTLGPTLQTFGLHTHLRLLSTHRDYLIGISRAVGEQAELAVFSDDELVVIDRANASDQFAGATGVGRRLPLHASSFGKASLALMPDDELGEHHLRRPLKSLTSRTVTDRSALLAQIDTIRSMQVAVDIDEYQVGACGIATATRSGGAIQAIAVIMPTGRMRQKAGLAIEALHRFNPLIDVSAAKRYYCR